MSVASKPRAAAAAGRREVVVLVCAQSVDAAFRPHRAEAGLPARLQVAMLPCTSKLEAGNLLAILERGADGILVLGCEAPRCRFQTGSARAARRLAYAQGILDEIGVGGWRLRLMLDGGRSEADVVRLAADFALELETLPPNPVRTLPSPFGKWGSRGF